ncbi:MAG: hypothetical protein MJK12_06160 [Colwellia sp.]|nr:hypothetical protein [Colwellia sp.]
MKYTLITMCKSLILQCLPNNINDNVCGDIEEEYNQLTAGNNSKLQSNLWLIKHTFITCGYFIMTTNKLWALLISAFSMSLFMMMALAIIWLSNYSDISEFSEQFWQQFSSGGLHLVFFEANFWQYSLQSLSKGFELHLWFDATAFIYSAIALLIIVKLHHKNNQSIKQFLSISISLMLLPYLLGSIVLATKNIPMIETGPIIATMWLTIFYLIIPISFQLIQKINHKKKG